MKNLFSITFFLGILILSGCSSPSPAKQEVPKTTPAAETITMSNVEKHNSESSCWMVVSGKVYDVTTAKTKHPGGDKILLGCGKDATSLFEARPHSPKAHDMLINYYLGDLK